MVLRGFGPSNSCCKSKVKMVLAKKDTCFCVVCSSSGFQGQILVVSVLFALLKPYFFFLSVCLFLFDRNKLQKLIALLLPAMVRPSAFPAAGLCEFCSSVSPCRSVMEQQSRVRSSGLLFVLEVPSF